MPYSPRAVKLAADHGALTHFGGIYFFHEFLRVLQLRHFLATHLTYPRRNHRYHLSQMILALVYPLVLGLDRLETVSLLRSNGTFQYLTGLSSFPDPQSLRRFLLQAPPRFWEQLHRSNDRLLQKFIHLPEHRSRLIFDLDSTVVTVFGRQDGAEVGYNPSLSRQAQLQSAAVPGGQQFLSLGCRTTPGECRDMGRQSGFAGHQFRHRAARDPRAAVSRRCRLRLRPGARDAGGPWSGLRRGRPSDRRSETPAAGALL